MRLALVADWLTTFGGAEHVIAELLDIFPDAPVFTTVVRRGKLGPIDKADIRTSGLQRAYALLGNHQVLLPWMPRAVEGFDLSGYDVILSSSHAVAKGVIPPPGALHLCYCHTPVRYAWEMEEEYLRDFRVPQWLRGTVRRELSKIRRWDLTTAPRVDRFFANSTTTQERIARIYGRTSTVLPPPVSDRFFESPLAEVPGEYFLAVGRLVPYKRFDLLIKAANALKLPLKIAGSGQDAERLKAMAGPTVEFLGFVPDAELPGLYANARALLFPQYEDAGIVLLEAQACGTPAIAYRAGGATDALKDGETGLFFDAQAEDDVRSAIDAFARHGWDRALIRRSARAFSRENFRQKLLAEVTASYDAFRARR
jgi:glycosyltransferase involved in cell wall biosynthesis